MTNKQINRYLKSFSQTRRQWVDTLNTNPAHDTACQAILAINAKMELLRGFWDWNDESVDMYLG